MTKAIEIELSTGKILLVHEPLTKDFGLFLSCMPKLMAISKSLSGLESLGAGNEVPVEDIPEGTIESIFPLMASLCNITEEEYKSLPLWDGITVLQALTELIPADFQKARQKIVSMESQNSTSGATVE